MHILSNHNNYYYLHYYAYFLSHHRPVYLPTLNITLLYIYLFIVCISTRLYLILFSSLSISFTVYFDVVAYFFITLLYLTWQLDFHCIVIVNVVP